MSSARTPRVSALQKRSFHSATVKPVISTNKGFETKFHATSPPINPASTNARTAWQDYRKDQEYQIQTLSSPVKGAFYPETPSTPASSSAPSVEKPSEAAPSTTFKMVREVQARSYKQELFLDETEGDLSWYKDWLGLGGCRA